MKLLQVKLNAKVGRKIAQTNYCLYRPLFYKIRTLAKRVRY